MVLCAPRSASAQSKATAERWLGELHVDVASDLVAGKPLVVHAHVPLCDNEIIWCGNPRLGDGDSTKTNLYWATSGGFVGWFTRRRGSGWRQVHASAGPGNVLEVRVWRRRFSPSGGLRAAGVDKPFDAYVVAFAWRGGAIREAMDAYTRDLYGGDPTVIELDDGTEVRAGGAAHIVSYVGHNGWMDVRRYDFAGVAAGAATPSRRVKGTIAIACITEDYLVPAVPAASRVPLLMTRSLMFAGAHGFEGAVTALAQGRDLAAIRRAAAQSYGRGQGKPYWVVSRLFTNPAHSTWKASSEE